MSKILMIGAHGMLGRPVARRLIKEGLEIRALARQPDKARSLLPVKAEVVRGDLKDVGSIDQALQGCAAVYVSVDTMPGASFHPETEGLRNVVAAAKNHDGIRLLALSALGNNEPRAADHPWWHIREKYDAIRIAETSGLAWTIFEPTWFMESIPLFIRGKSCLVVSGVRLSPHWVSGDDYARIVAAALRKNIGQGEHIAVQGPEKLDWLTASKRFIAVFDPSLKLIRLPFALLKAAGRFNRRAGELAQLLKLCDGMEEPPPDPRIGERYAAPQMRIEDYARYVRDADDFPQK